MIKKKREENPLFPFVLALPIFAASRPATIVGVSELNFCVRDGNRWTLTPINTNYVVANSAPFRPPIGEHPLRSVAPPFPHTTHFVGLVRGPREDARFVCSNLFTFSCTLKTEHQSTNLCRTLRLLRSSPRLISISQLNTLLRLHP